MQVKWATPSKQVSDATILKLELPLQLQWVPTIFPKTVRDNIFIATHAK